MTAHLVITRQLGRLRWAIEHDRAGRVNKPDPMPIAVFELTDDHLAIGGEILFRRYCYHGSIEMPRVRVRAIQRRAA